MSGTWWSIVTIGGPILFGVVLIWAILRNRRTPREVAHTEQATRDLREEMTAERRHRETP